MINNVGEKIRQARISHNLSQEELGKKLGVQKSIISKYEKNLVDTIPRDKLQILHTVLELSYMELLGLGDTDPLVIEINNLNLDRNNISRLLEYAKLLKLEQNKKDDINE